MQTKSGTNYREIWEEKITWKCIGAAMRPVLQIVVRREDKLWKLVQNLPGYEEVLINRLVWQEAQISMFPMDWWPDRSTNRRAGLEESIDVRANGENNVKKLFGKIQISDHFDRSCSPPCSPSCSPTFPRDLSLSLSLSCSRVSTLALSPSFVLVYLFYRSFQALLLKCYFSYLFFQNNSCCF